MGDSFFSKEDITKISIGSEDEKRVETLWNYYQNEEKNG